MWGSTKGKTSTNKILTRLLNQPSPKVRSRKVKGTVSRIVRDHYGSATEWFALCKAVKERDKWCCVRCLAKENSKEGTYHEVHHIRSLSKGGKTVMANLITLCRRCHNKRHKHLRGRE